MLHSSPGNQLSLMAVSIAWAKSLKRRLAVENMKAVRSINTVDRKNSNSKTCLARNQAVAKFSFESMPPA